MGPQLRPYCHGAVQERECGFVGKAVKHLFIGCISQAPPVQSWHTMFIMAHTVCAEQLLTFILITILNTLFQSHILIAINHNRPLTEQEKH